jgi:hypothetical protein
VILTEEDIIYQFNKIYHRITRLIKISVAVIMDKGVICISLASSEECGSFHKL